MRRARLLSVLALLLVVSCAGDDRTPLLIYSPHGREMLEAFGQAFEAEHPDVRVEWLDMGSQEVLDRVRSERARPQADVWWGGPANMFVSAAEDGLLEVYEPSWAAGIPAEAHDAEDRWYGLYYTPPVIAYNSAVLDAESAPRDWADMLDPTWADQVLIRDPLASGTMRTIFSMVIHRSLEETGDTAAGFDWLRQLDAQTKEYVLNPTLLYQKLARQEGLVTLWNMPDIEIAKNQQGLPLDYVIPSSGTPLPADGVAVVAGAPQPELARAFVDFVGSDEGMIMAAREFARFPARTDLPEDSLPESLRRAREEMISEPIDWDLLRTQESIWMRHWDAHVRGRGSGG